jgi:hypothetical protein
LNGILTLGLGMACGFDGGTIRGEDLVGMITIDKGYCDVC